MKFPILLFACFYKLVFSYGQGMLQITFDGTPPAPPGSSISFQHYIESGMSFTPIMSQQTFSRVGAGYPADPQNGTAYLRTAFTQSLMFSFIPPSLFSLVSVDLSEYSTGLPQPVTVHFNGYHPDGSAVTVDLTTDGIIDGTGPLADFQTFNFGKAFTGLSRVEIPNSGWSLDNLVVSVPEPSTVVLLFAGGLVLGALKLLSRRREQ